MQGQVANSVDQLHLSSVVAVEFDWLSVENHGTAGKTESKKTETFF